MLHCLYFTAKGTRLTSSESAVLASSGPGHSKHPHALVFAKQGRCTRPCYYSLQLVDSQEADGSWQRCSGKRWARCL